MEDIDLMEDKELYLIDLQLLEQMMKILMMPEMTLMMQKRENRTTMNPRKMILMKKMTSLIQKMRILMEKMRNLIKKMTSPIKKAMIPMKKMTSPIKKTMILMKKAKSYLS